MKHSAILLPTFLFFSLSAAACSSGDVTCEEVVKHTKKVVPEMANASSDKDMLAQCEGSSQAARKCAMDTTDLAGLVACAQKAK